MVRLMEEKYGQASRIWVMDRGIVSEDNLDSLRERKAAYIVGTPKGQLRQFEGQLDEHDWSQVQPGVKSNWSHTPIYRKEQYVIARSGDRAEKESAMLAQSKARLRQARTDRREPSKAVCQTRHHRAASVVGWGVLEPSGSQVTIRTAEIAKPQPAPSGRPYANHGRRRTLPKSTAHLG